MGLFVLSTILQRWSNTWLSIPPAVQRKALHACHGIRIFPVWSPSTLLYYHRPHCTASITSSLSASLSSLLWGWGLISSLYKAGQGLYPELETLSSSVNSSTIRKAFYSINSAPGNLDAGYSLFTDDPDPATYLFIIYNFILIFPFLKTFMTSPFLTSLGRFWPLQV